MENSIHAYITMFIYIVIYIEYIYTIHITIFECELKAYSKFS